MIWSIFCILLFIGLVISIVLDEGKDCFGNLMGSFIIFVIMWGFGMLLGGLALEDFNNTPIRKTFLKEKVYSVLVKNGGVSGSFFLGCGGFKSGSPKYLMFCNNEGGKQLLEVSANSTIIYEDEEKTPYIVRKVFYEYDYSTANLWFCHFKSDGRWEELDEYKLHVPKGTIRVNPDEIDLSKLN